jgi:hypothetical protein
MKRMNEVITLLEYVLNEQIANGSCVVRLYKGKGGNLENRSAFLRKSYRQTTLDEFVDIDFGSVAIAQPHYLHYTIHPRELFNENILSLYHKLKDDIADYLIRSR